jgi:S-adenosylmethionine uptake transporter
VSAGAGVPLPHMALAFVGFTLWTVGDALVHALEGRPPVAVAFWVSVAGLAALLALSPRLGGLAQTFRTPYQGLQWARGLALAISGLLTIYAFMSLPLATAYALVFVQPFCAKALSAVLTGERPRPAAWAASAVGFAGVLIVLRPGLVPISWPALAALGSAGFFALGYVLTRHIGQANQTTLGTAIYRHILSLALLPLLAGGPGGLALVPADLPWVAVIGLFGVGGILTVSRAFAAAPAAYVSPVHYTQILWGVAFGALFFGEVPDAWTVAGAAVIIAAGLWLASGARTKQEAP